jgi:NitT/TauT family transport system substrate-binding protein
VTLRLNWTIYGEHAPFFVAKESGYYRDEGLDVEILQGSGSANTARLIGQGSGQFGYVGSDTMAQLVSQGVEVRSVAVFSQINPMAVIFSMDRPIKSFDDMRNKTYGVTTGDANSQLFPAMLRAIGLSEKDVSLIHLPTPKAKEDALIDGRIDAFLGYYVDQPPRLKHLDNMNLGWLRYADAGITTLSSGIVVHREFIETHPDLIRRFIRASLRGLSTSRENPQYAAKILHQNVSDNIPMALAEDWIRLAQELNVTDQTKGLPLGWAREEDWQSTLDLLRDFSDFRGNQKIETYFTNEFIQ